MQRTAQRPFAMLCASTRPTFPGGTSTKTEFCLIASKSGSSMVEIEARHQMLLRLLAEERAKDERPYDWPNVWSGRPGCSELAASFSRSFYPAAAHRLKIDLPQLACRLFP